MKKIIILILALIMLLLDTSGLFADGEISLRTVTQTQAQTKEQTPEQNKTDEEQSVIRRFALVVGANYGGRNRVRLQYAVSDAKSILNVLESLGGVSPDDSRLLIEPDREALFWEMKRLKERVERVREKHGRIEVIFYYSGHSDQKNILLGKEKVSYQEFKDEISSVPADVRIAILDSCASGAFTRLKGGKKKSPFLVDTAYDMKGYAVLTSSSSGEASQESERLKGSFFTHYLTSGLRGAADMSQDGRVTLHEAYQFAFQETLQQTEKTVSGPQHPNRDVRMSGTGDVVMTDIRRSSALLILTEDVSGTIFIHDKKSVLVAELKKPAGRAIELGLDEGKYRVINIAEGKVFEAKIQLKDGKIAELRMDQFRETDQIDAVARGDMNYKKRKVFKRRGKKTNFFIAYSSKYTRAYHKSALMAGAHFGLTFNKQFSFGFAGYANLQDFPLGHPTYWGAKVEYALPSRGMFNYKASLLAGSGEEYLLARHFFILEPEFGVTFNVTRLFNIYTGISYRFTSIEDTVMSPFSLCFSFRLGK